MSKLAIMLPIALLVLLPACVLSPRTQEETVLYLRGEKAKRDFRRAGYVAAIGWLAIKKVDEERAAKLRPIVEEMRDTVRAYKEGGFKGLLPEIEARLKKRFPTEEQKPYRLIGLKLAEALFDELDARFDKFRRNETWKNDEQVVADLLKRFFTGAVEGIENYLDD